jgi:hypothetical protein
LVVSAAQAGRRLGGLARRRTGGYPSWSRLVSRVQPGGEVQAELTVGYWWAAGAFWGGAVICGALIRGGTRLHLEAGQPEPVDQVISGPI